MSVFQILGSLFFMISFMIIIIFLFSFEKLRVLVLPMDIKHHVFFIVWKEYSAVGSG